jgi:hypothetical protein
MSVFKYHAFIYFMRPPPWYGTAMIIILIIVLEVISSIPKTLDRRPCTGRSQGAVVIFLFGLEALFTRDSRVLLCAVSSFPKVKAAIGYFSYQNHFLLAPTAIRPVSNPLLSSCGPWENTVLLKCRHPHCMHCLFI